MDTAPQDISHLFEQLGLDNSQEAIDTFISSHVIDSHVLLSEASFWNISQQSFLKEALEEDAQWSQVIDQLDTLLRR